MQTSTRRIFPRFTYQGSNVKPKARAACHIFFGLSSFAKRRTSAVSPSAGNQGLAQFHRQTDFALFTNRAAGDPVTGVTRRIGLLVVSLGMHHECGAAVAK